jgi:glycosyltransferase involved in cell wall biosynthesis
MPTPKVSVVVTTYNRADLLPRAIDSVLAQRFPGDQVQTVIVDDGSTDGTGELVRTRYATAVEYFYKPNGGMNSASQFGIARARGEIVALLDSDDYWYDNKLARCVPLFEQAADVVAVLHDLDRVLSASGAKLGRYSCDKSGSFGTEPRDALQHYLSGKPVKAMTSALLLRREALLKTLPIPDGIVNFHDAYYIRNIIFFGRICAVHEPLGAYAIHSTNDYGYKPHAELSEARLELLITETRLMAEAFNRRCEQFGVHTTAERARVQRFATAELEIERERRRGTIPAVGKLLRNDLQLDMRERLQLLTRLTLPNRVAAFLNNRILAGPRSLD